MIVVPSSPPQNVSIYALNSTSIFVSWRPPIVTDQNGQIIFYNISVVDLKDNNSTSVLESSDTNITITGMYSVHLWHKIVSSWDRIQRIVLMACLLAVFLF